MKRILMVSHCLLNTASKVERYKEPSIQAEECLRKEVLRKAIEEGVQLIQLPCPEFIMYGAKRWGHTFEQFDNPFYRQKCREILMPLMLELKEYAAQNDVCLLGVLGIDGSPSCGVKYTCRGPWGGEFSGRNVEPVLKQAGLAEGPGVLMEVLMEMLEENGLKLPVEGLFAKEPERALRLIAGEQPGGLVGEQRED